MLPGWNSLETVSRLHSFFEVSGIVVLAMLVLAEVAAYKYGRRKEELLEADSVRLRAEVRAAEVNATQARAEASAIAGRRVSVEQEQALKRVLSTLPSGRMWILAYSGDGEGIAYSKDLARVIRAAGWQVDVGNSLFWGPQRPGLILGVMGPKGTPHTTASNLAALPKGVTPRGAALLSQALKEAGLETETTYETWEEPNEEDFSFKRGVGSFGLTIGHKP